MASLTIRNIPEDAKRRFRARAAAKGHSMEEEARQLILATVADNDDRPGIFEMIYQATRPGFDLPAVHDTPASFAHFDK